MVSLLNGWKHRREHIPAQMTGIKEEYLSEYMKAAGWFSLSLVCPRDGLAGVKGHARLFFQGKLPWWLAGDKINVSNLRLAAAQSKVPLCGTWHHTKCIRMQAIDGTDLIKLIKTSDSGNVCQYLSESARSKEILVHRWKRCRQAEKAVWWSAFIANKVIM